VITVTGFSGPYDGNAHGVISSSAKGVNNEDLIGLSIDPTTYTNVPGGLVHWTFTNQNYADQSGDANVAITKANATINVTPYNVTFDNAAHTATGTAKGVQGENLAGLDLSGTTHTDVNNYNDTWTFTDVTGNYNNATNTINDVIGLASSTTTITCTAGPFIYNGSPFTPCTATATGPGLSTPVTPVNYGNNLNAGTATADATYAGDSNHTGSSATQVTFLIGKRTLTAAINGDPTKVYDGNSNATLISANYVVSNFVGSQSVTVNKTTGTYNTKDVATANTVSTSLAAGDFTAGAGTNLNNYNLPTNANGAGHITAKALNIKADDKSMNFGGATPTFTVSYLTLATGDSASSFGGTLTFTVKNSANTPVTINGSSSNGIYTIIPSGLTNTNYNITFQNGTLTINSWWTITGFYQPVDMSSGTGYVLNTVKGGSTVPLKFNIYAGTPGPLTERKSIADVMFSTVQVAEYNCAMTPGYESPVDVSNTGNTSLRYDTSQFIQNWQTPKVANKCYEVRMTAIDGSHIDAYFKTK